MAESPIPADQTTARATDISQDPDLTTLTGFTSVDAATWSKARNAITGLFNKVHEGTLPIGGVAQALDGAIQRAQDTSNENVVNLLNQNLISDGEFLVMLVRDPGHPEAGKFTPEDRDAVASLVDRANNDPNIRIYGGRGRDIGQSLDYFLQANPDILNVNDRLSTSLKTLGEKYIQGRTKDPHEVATVTHIKSAIRPPIRPAA